MASAASRTPHPDPAASPSSGSTGDTDGASPYTGVVVIHGIGDIERNTTLKQVLDALSYWLNHEAGFALRSEGPGRLWLVPRLADDDNPDAPAARATVELSAPARPAGASGDSAGLRMQFREVWWAASFGQPKVTTTIRWARVQWHEQWLHLLIPFGHRLGPARTAARAPARETPQALTYRPRDPSRDIHAASVDWVAASTEVRGQEPLGDRLRRQSLRAALWLYDLFQYLWKALQWLILTPAITLALWLASVVQVFAMVPFLRPAIVASFNALTSVLMLHWIAPLQMFQLDYTRSAALRQRFEREVDTFLRDPLCQRVAVLAHSEGSVIAYEGLTTALAQPDLPDAAKPVTFMSLGSALHRAWLMSDVDPHRLHGVLPERVRWLNFWARYDPVAAGPLSARSLTPQDDWNDPTEPDPYPAICASLERCENIDVVNTDSSFTDHGGYWDNFEQVIGPIALELVAGHPDLERVVRAHLASDDAVLWRRGRVAWRSMVAIVSGLVVGTACWLWDYLGNPQPGTRLPFGFGHGMIVFGPGIISQAIGAITPNAIQTALSAAWHDSPFAQAIQALTSTYVAVPQSLADGAASLVAAVVIAGLATAGIRRLITLPSPLDYPAGAPQDIGTPRSIPVLAAISLIFLALGVAPLDPYHSDLGIGFRALVAIEGGTIPDNAVVATYLLAVILGAIAAVLSLMDAARRQRWGWFLVLLLNTLAFASPLVTQVANASDLTRIPLVQGSWSASLAYNVVYTAAPIGLVGVGLGALQELRRRHWATLVGLLLVLLALGDAMASAIIFWNAPGLPPPYTIGLEFYIAAVLPILLYGLWSDPHQRAAEHKVSPGRAVLPNAAVLRIESLALVSAFVFIFFIPTAIWRPIHLYLGGIDLVIALVGAALAFTALIRARRWGWIAVVVVLPLACASAAYFRPPYDLRYLLTFRMLPFTVWYLFGFLLSVGLLTAGMWAAPVAARQEQAVSRPVAISPDGRHKG